jgi:regulator of ribonuclease activity A
VSLWSYRLRLTQGTAAGKMDQQDMKKKSGNFSYYCADLCDDNIQSPQPVHVVQPNLFQSYGGKLCFHGKIVTIRCFESNGLVRQTLFSEEGKGKVLVVDGGGSTRVALLGDRLASMALLQHWEGIIINGCVRDTAVLRTMPIGIKAIGSTPVKSLKLHPGDKNVKISFGGTEFIPGHWIYADEVSKLKFA